MVAHWIVTDADTLEAPSFVKSLLLLLLEQASQYIIHAVA